MLPFLVDVGTADVVVGAPDVVVGVADIVDGAAVLADVLVKDADSVIVDLVVLVSVEVAATALLDSSETDPLSEKISLISPSISASNLTGCLSATASVKKRPLPL